MGGMHATLLRHFAADIQLKDGEKPVRSNRWGESKMRGLRDVSPSALRSHVEQLHWKRVPLQEFLFVSFLEGELDRTCRLKNRKWFFQPPKLWQNCQGNFRKQKKRWVWVPRLKIASTNASRAACFSEEATDWRSYSWKGINWASTNWAEQWKNRLFRVYRGLYYPDI